MNATRTVYVEAAGRDRHGLPVAQYFDAGDTPGRRARVVVFPITEDDLARLEDALERWVRRDDDTPGVPWRIDAATADMVRDVQALRD